MADTDEQRLRRIEARIGQVAVWAADPVKRLTRVQFERLSAVVMPPCELPLPGNPDLVVGLPDGRSEGLDLRALVKKDTLPIPATVDREGYCGEHHLAYWISGLIDFVKVRDAALQHSRNDPISVLDLGCASGRFLRHPVAQQPDWSLTGCDIDAMNVAWVKKYLPPTVTAFQNTIYPHLPLPDASFDIITAFSVFTHMDKLEDAWLLECRRILKPGGLLYVTAHTDRVWARVPSRPAVLVEMLRCRPEWSTPQKLVINESLFRQPMPEDHIVLRFEAAGAYVAQTFHSDRHIRENWGRLFEILAIHDNYHMDFQDVVLLRKSG